MVKKSAPTEKKSRKVGRPTVCSKALTERICSRLAAGESLNSICKDDGMPAKANVFKWLLSDSDTYKEFRDKYAKAREIQYHQMADEILNIADDGTNDYIELAGDEGAAAAYRVNGEAVARSRLRVDTRKWFMSKVLPKFADKQVVDHTSSDRSMTPKDTSSAVLAAIEAKYGAKPTTDS